VGLGRPWSCSGRIGARGAVQHVRTPARASALQDADPSPAIRVIVFLAVMTRAEGKGEQWHRGGGRLHRALMNVLLLGVEQAHLHPPPLTQGPLTASAGGRWPVGFGCGIWKVMAADAAKPGAGNAWVRRAT
jgi:hypothetical protein